MDIREGERALEALTNADAFVALRVFLRRYWEMKGAVPGDLGDLLADIMVPPYGGDSPADPAAWRDWLDAIDETRAESRLTTSASPQPD